jgi:DNA replication protein DnaC
MAWRQIMPGVYEGLPDKPGEAEISPPDEGENAEVSAESHVRLSNIPTVTMTTHRLSTWKHRESEPWWAKITAYAERDYDHPFVTLIGPRGTGKTHIAFAIGWEWLRQGAGVLYYHVEDLLDGLRHGYTVWQKGSTDGYEVILEFTRHANLLILDDLGAHNETGWAEVKLDQIVDYRYEHRKPMIATTNLALNRLPERIADRLSEGLLIQLKGESYRKNVRQQK